ncbi:Xylose isomerase domain protein TIM barrel [Pirellula staleyi DSM 6068]|uniref:Xylose isomerase domain protein TIM barrel n=1 Tax=Pirellula staleyi (strain ATCC 27377 / DSM 6068 / ICPB 4128) TaxID=530564 RepID=D2R7C8_PIRSD|nr:sugar phosphate isomerase/epimerase family protein [Pirellula staleyi]ADB15624.1 Xylose isomerase domain protein TIM barrel [Pirellula staleyi DSM 6068]
MIRSAVTVSLVAEAQGGPFVFWYDLQAAAAQASRLGFDAIEIFPPGPEAIPAHAVTQLTSGLDLAVAAVGTGAGWVKHKLHLCQPEKSQRDAAKLFIRSMIEAAAAIGAPAIIGSMQGRWDAAVDRKTAVSYLLEGLEELGEFAEKNGQILIYEPLNRYETNLATTLRAASELLAPLSTKNVKLLADLFHMNIEETDLAVAIRTASDTIGHVHFVDSNRRAAGMGHMDYGPIAAALQEIKYDRYLSAEALALPDSVTAAEQTIHTFQKYFPR